MGILVKYDSNNSGGHWWLSTEDYKNLEEAGWTVHWVQPSEKYTWYETPSSAYSDDKDEVLKKVPFHEDGDWLGAKASSCAKYFEDGSDIQDAINEWEEITGESASEIGCNCCGAPHSFTYTEDYKPKQYVEIDFPSQGELIYS